jgi:molybdate transport system substrate-binding protein
MSTWSCRVSDRKILAAAALLLSACTLSSPGQGTATPPRKLTVFAASSLQPAFDKVARNVALDVTFNYAGSQTLSSQLTQGARADVFASADTAHMKTVQDAGLLAGSAQLFARNRLEIAVEKGNPKGIHTLADLARPGLVVVLADPSVPAGKYAQQALAKAGVTVHPKSLEPQVTGVLSKVALGEADAGIVYVSDVVTSGKVDGIAIPDSVNVIADYPIAKLKGGQNSAAADTFIAYVLSSQGQAILVQAGFEIA